MAGPGGSAGADGDLAESGGLPGGSLDSFTFPIPALAVQESLVVSTLDQVAGLIGQVLTAIEEAVGLEIAAIQRAIDTTWRATSKQVEKEVKTISRQVTSTMQQALARVTTGTQEVRQQITSVAQAALPQRRAQLLAHQRQAQETATRLRQQAAVEGSHEPIALAAEASAWSAKQQLQQLDEAESVIQAAAAGQPPPQRPPEGAPQPPPAPGRPAPPLTDGGAAGAGVYTSPVSLATTAGEETTAVPVGGKPPTGQSGSLRVGTGDRLTVAEAEAVVDVLAGGDQRERPAARPRGRVAGAGDEAAPGRDVAPGCDLPGWLAGGIPIPGSRAWCRVQDEVRGAMVRLGQALADLVLSSLDHAGPLADADSDVWSDLAGAVDPVSVVAGTVFAALQRVGVDIRGQLRRIIQCWRSLVGMLAQCDPSIMLALTVLRGVIRALKHFRVGVNIVVQGHLQLALDLDTLDRTVTYLIEAACPTVIPPPASAAAAYLRGGLDRDLYECWLRSHGVDPDVYESVMQAQRAIARPDDLVLASRLAGEGADLLTEQLQLRGWTDQRDTRSMLAGYDRPASPQESLRLNQGRLDPRWGAGAVALDAGFGEYWASPAGLADRAQGLTEMRARGLWREGWTGIVDAGAARQAMRAAGADPALTDYPGRVQYRPLSLPDVSQRATLRQLEPQRVVVAALDAGYTPVDADTVAETVLWSAARSNALDKQTWTISMLASAVRVGVTDADGIRPQLSAQGYMQEDLDATVRGQRLAGRTAAVERARATARGMTARAALAAYRVGMTSADTASQQLVAAGWDATSASAALAATDALFLAADTARQIQALTRAYLRGMMSAQQLRLALARSGLRPDRVDQYTNTATVQGIARHPGISAQQVGRLVSEGLLTPAQGVARLTRLGFTRPDSLLLSAEWAHRLRQAQAKAVAGTSRAARSAIQSAERVKRQAQAQMRRQEPPSFLHRGFLLGMLTPDYVRGKLGEYGYLPTTIDHYLTLWGAEREAGLSKRQAAEAKAIASGAAERPG